jgi:hypothetical protein
VPSEVRHPIANVGPPAPNNLRSRRRDFVLVRRGSGGINAVPNLQERFELMVILSPRRLGLWSAGVAFASLFMPSLPASAQSICGDAPKGVPQYIQELLKGDVEDKAQALTKLRAGAEIKGSVDTSKAELYEQHKNLDRHQIDMYLSRVSCQAIMADKAIPTIDRLKMWKQVRSEFPASNVGDTQPARNPNALYQYGEAVADVQDAIVSQVNSTVTFQTGHTTGKADPAQEVEYQDWVLSCPGLPASRPDVVAGQFSEMIDGEICNILRKRPGSQVRS